MTMRIHDVALLLLACIYERQGKVKQHNTHNTLLQHTQHTYCNLDAVAQESGHAWVEVMLVKTAAQGPWTSSVPKKLLITVLKVNRAPSFDASSQVVCLLFFILSCEKVTVHRPVPHRDAFQRLFPPLSSDVHELPLLDMQLTH